MKEQRECDALVPLLDKNGFGVPPLAEQRLAQGVLGGFDLVLELLEPRELPDEPQDVRNVRVLRLDNSRFHRPVPERASTARKAAGWARPPIQAFAPQI